MAASDVSIVNRALDNLGHQPITSFADDVTGAKLASRSYEQLRDAVLAAHPWNFAIKREALAASATSPVWEYASAYPVPDDYLRCLGVENASESYEWKVESIDGSPAILTDLGAPLKIRYIARIEDPTKYSPLFIEALAARLALEWADPITGQTTTQAKMAELYQSKLAEARSIDGQEGTPQKLDVSSWTDSRI